VTGYRLACLLMRASGSVKNTAPRRQAAHCEHAPFLIRSTWFDGAGCAMTIRSVAYSGILAGLMSLSIVSEAAAQLTKSSGGITFTISKVLTSGSNVIIQFNATNNTMGRVYIRDAQFDDRQKAFLGSGPQLSWPTITGLELCADTVAGCTNPAAGQHGDDLNKYDYIQPGEFLSFSFNYQTPSPAQASDTISFGIGIVARYSQPNGNPQEAGPMQAVRQNFPYVPLGHQ
jgi:hypothetical protein